MAAQILSTNDVYLKECTLRACLEDFGNVWQSLDNSESCDKIETAEVGLLACYGE